MAEGEEAAITVWGRKNSVNVMKVLWGSDEIELRYKQIDAGKPFPFCSADPAFLEKNPNGLVPVIQDNNANGFVLWESNACIKYLASRYQDPAKLELYPIDLVERADAERWSDWASTSMADPMGVLWRGILRTAPAERNHAALKTAWPAAVKAWRIFNQHLARSGNKYAIGDKFTFADVCLGGNVNRWFLLLRENSEIASLGLWDSDDSPLSPKKLEAELSALSSYLERLSQREAFKKNVQPYKN